MNSRHVRFSDAKWLQEPSPNITIGGVGGIGSWLAFFLGRIGFPLIVYETDTIDETNMGGQLYATRHIGISKTEALIENLESFSNFSSIVTLDKFEEGSMVTPFVFSCFDNMKARKDMFESWKKLENKELFIDGRMLAESFQIYCVTPDKIADYEVTLFDDSEVPDLACSYKATSHCGAMISSNMVAILTNYLTNRNTGRELRYIPFNISMEISLMKYEVN